MGLLDPIEKGFGQVNAQVFRQVNRAVDWWKLPLPAALMNLRAFRDDLREYNLYDTAAAADGDGAAAATRGPTSLPHLRRSLTIPSIPRWARPASRFGRNAPDRRDGPRVDAAS